MDLLDNPFYILKATTRDSRRRIVELSDDRSLVVDPSACMKARSDLTNPRKRLSAELGWLLGIGPKRIEKLLMLLSSSPQDLFSVNGLSSIARTNLLAAALARVSVSNISDLASWILEIARDFENVDANEVMALINEERVVAGLPEITDVSVVEAEILERRRYYCRVITSALKQLPPKEYVEAVTACVSRATEDGDEAGPILIGDLVDSYEVEVQPELREKEAIIVDLVERARDAVDSEEPDPVVGPMISQLIQSVREWDLIAQPIQISAKSRGLDHDASHRVAGVVRGLAIHVFNEHNKFEFSCQLTNMLQEVFAEVGQVAELTAEDADTLAEIAKQREVGKIVKGIRDLCQGAQETATKYPYCAAGQAQKVLIAAPHMIARLSELEAEQEVVSQASDTIALTVMQCAIVYGNSEMKWKTCVRLLETACEYACGDEVRDRILDNLATAKKNDRLFDGVTPVSCAPPLFTLNGTGVRLYGSSDHDPELGTCTSTYYLVCFWIPLCPLRRYRVIPSDDGYRFIGKVPLRTVDKWHIALFVCLIGLMFLRS